MNSGHFRKGIYKTGVFVTEANFHIDFNGAFLDGFAFDHTAVYVSFYKILCVHFRFAPVAADYDYIRVCVGFFVNENKKNGADNNASENRKRDHSRRKNNAHGDGPEEERNIKGLFDCGSETDYGKSTDHTEGKNNIACYGKDNKSCNHGERNKRNAKAGRIHNPGKSLFINKENKKTDSESKSKGDHHIKDTYARNVFEEAGFKNIVKSYHSKNFPFFWFSRRFCRRRILKKRRFGGFQAG